MRKAGKRSANPPLRVCANQGNAVFPVPRQEFVELFVRSWGLFEDITEICKGLNTVELAGFDGDATFRRHLHLGFAEPGAEGLQQGARCWRASAF